MAVAFGLAGQAGEQVPDPVRGGTRPVAFCIMAQQHSGQGDADESGVVERAGRPGPVARLVGRDHLIVRLDVER